MSGTITLTTELDAINQMLDVIGEAPVASVDDTGLVDATMARDLLRRVSRQVQSMGWHWNTDKSVELLPENPLPGIIRVPVNAARLDPSDVSVDAVVREGKLWNRKELTFLWSSSVLCKIVYIFPFDSLPEAARDYIAIRASRMFQDRRIGSETRNGFNERDEAMAKVTLENAESQTRNLTLADSHSVFRALNPWAPQGGGWLFPKGSR
jgi:hypothetical protein